MTATIVLDGDLVTTTKSRPDARDGSVQIEVDLAGVNFWDIMQRRGAVPNGPGGTPGVEGTGVVRAVSSDADEHLLGQRVAWSKVPGSYAQFVVTDPRWLLPVPADLDSTTAAGVLMQGVTAHYLAADTAPLGAGDTAVVMAAAGGVGTLLTQLLTARGVTVLGIVGSAAKASTALAVGATDVLVGDDALGRIRELATDGVQAVFDGNGGPGAAAALSTLAPRGWLVLYGTAAGKLPALGPDDLAVGSFVLTRTAGKHFAGTPDAWRPRAEEIMASAADGTLRVITDSVMPLSEAGDAHRRMEQRATSGKVLLDPSR